MRGTCSAPLKALTKPCGCESSLFKSRISRRRRYTSSGPSIPKPIPAFTSSSLSEISGKLISPPTWTLKNPPPHTVKPTKRPVREAAILIPLMNIAGEPNVLLEVRASHMRTHAGEVSFPGGRMDPSDSSMVETALRETEEELALPRENVEILGMLNAPEYSLGNRSRVWPLVGFVHSDPSSPRPTDLASPLESFSISKLIASPDEVSAILPLPLSLLRDPRRQTTHYFRLDVRRPYQKIVVSDLVSRDVLGGADTKEQGQLEVWGLSGWFLNRLAWDLGWLLKPPPLVYES